MGAVIHKLKQFIDHKGITVKAFEEKSSMSSGLFGKMLKNDGSIGSDKLENILSAFPELNPNWLFGDDPRMIMPHQSNVNSVREDQAVYNGGRGVPLFDVEADAGQVTIFDDLNNQGPIDQISIPDLPKCDGAVYIRGDSMYPILKSGDIVVYKILHDKRNSFIWGEMYLLSLSIEGDRMITAKYVQRSEHADHIRLVSHNSHHQDFDVHIDNVLSFAIIKVSIRKNTI